MTNARILRQMAAIADRLAAILEEIDLSNGASKVMFYVEGTGEVLGEYLMYNPPITGDDLTFNDGETFTVVRRNVDVKDNFVRITVRASDEH